VAVRRVVGARVVGVVGAAVLALAGCTQSVAGTGRAAPDASSTPEPTGSSGPAPSFGESVTIIESRRLAFAVPRPDLVDRAFTKTCLPTLPLKNVDALGGFGGLFVDRSVDVFRRSGFVAGYVQCRSDPTSGRGTVAAAIEMRDDNGARKAARDLVPTLLHEGDKAAPLAGVSEATAVTGVDNTTHRQVLQTVIAFGRLVLYQYSDDRDQQRLVRTAVTTLQSALDRARQYEPTPLDEMNSLQDDPRHLRPLLAEPKGATYVNGGGYGLDAYYGVAEDPDTERALLKRAGFQGVYSNQGDHEGYWVYELRDAAAARTVLTGFTAIDKRMHPKLVQLSVRQAGSPSFCFAFMEDSVPVQRCFFPAKKYLYQVDVFGFDAKDLRNPRHVAAAVVKQKAKAPK
jgi:hypothetical protein